MKKIFVSVPMNGRDEIEILNTRDRIIKSLKKVCNCELLETYYRDDAPPEASRLWYLGRSIQDLGLADLVIFAPGWQYAKGCVTEHHVCEVYNIPYVDWADTTEGLVRLLARDEDDLK